MRPVTLVLANASIVLLALSMPLAAAADTLLQMRYFQNGRPSAGYFTAPTSIETRLSPQGSEPYFVEHRQRTQTAVIPDPTSMGGFVLPLSGYNPIQGDIQTFMQGTAFGGTLTKTFPDPALQFFTLVETTVQDLQALPATVVTAQLISGMQASAFPGATSLQPGLATRPAYQPGGEGVFGPGVPLGGATAPVTHLISDFFPNANGVAHPTLTNSNYTGLLSGTLMATPGPNQFGGTLRRMNNAPTFLIRQSVTSGGASGLYQTGTVPAKFGGDNITTMEGGGSAGPTYITRVTMPGDFKIKPTPNAPTTFATFNFTVFFDEMPHWQTGVVSAMALTSMGGLSTYIDTGFDNPAATGPNGTTRVMQLVMPRITHSTFSPGNAPESRKMQLTFLPEPGSLALIGFGALGLLGLNATDRYRRRSS